MGVDWELTAKISTWVLNAALVACGVLAILNWSAFVWIIGSAGLGTFLEILGIVCLVYILVAGCCLLPFQSRLKMSYLQLREASCCQYTTIFFSILLFAFFTTVGLLALLPLPVTDAYSQRHANDVFSRADTNKDHMLDFHEFSEYTLQLESFRGRGNDSNFRSLMSRVFDAMDHNGDGFVTEASMNAGVTQALKPTRERFGWAMTTIGLIVAIFSVMFWCWYASFKRAKVEQDLPQERGEDEALMGNEDDAGFLPDHLDESPHEYSEADHPADGLSSRGGNSGQPYSSNGVFNDLDEHKV